ncbi:hypothetical protein D3C81_1943510 [compost metagenome]
MHSACWLIFSASIIFLNSSVRSTDSKSMRSSFGSSSTGAAARWVRFCLALALAREARFCCLLAEAMGVVP